MEVKKTAKKKSPRKISIDSPEAYVNRELSWLNFARRVLAMVEDRELPLMERIKFAGIVGMLHDEFFMKRMSGLRRTIKRQLDKVSIDGKTPREQMDMCRREVLQQMDILSEVMREDIRPSLRELGIPILDYQDLSKTQRKHIQEYFRDSVQPILTPLAVDAEHPFPFISNLGLNLAVQIFSKKKNRNRFVRIKIPDNRPRWIPLPENQGFVPLEQIIAANIKDLFPKADAIETYFFRVTRGADGEPEEPLDLDYDYADISFIPGSIIHQVTNELKARRFAGVVRLQVDHQMPEKLRRWLSAQLKVEWEDMYEADYFLGMCDLMDFRIKERGDLSYPPHKPLTHPRLRDMDFSSTSAIFKKMRAGDILLHHPYHNFDSSVLHFLNSAALDPDVLAIKLTIYRTSSDSPIIKALTEAVRRGKQVAVLVEVTARFDEAPNIAWGKLLENEGAHVSYGVEKLKTHVKLALVVREEQGSIRRYLHVGTGNYHSGTARLYEDLGMLTCDPVLCDDAAAVFNELTGATPFEEYRKLLVAPHDMRQRFVEMIRREAEHARAQRPCGIHAKMNQLQDPEIIRELYLASQAGVPVTLNVRGLCCLRPGVAGLSENIRVYGLVGRFLEHSRIYSFVNGGDPVYYFGSADWMRRNLNRRVETISPVMDDTLKQQLKEILEVYEQDNTSAWDCQPDGSYIRRRPAEGEERRSAQDIFIEMGRYR